MTDGFGGQGLAGQMVAQHPAYQAASPPSSPHDGPLEHACGAETDRDQRLTFTASPSNEAQLKWTDKLFPPGNSTDLQLRWEERGQGRKGGEERGEERGKERGWRRRTGEG